MNLRQCPWCGVVPELWTDDEDSDLIEHQANDCIVSEERMWVPKGDFSRWNNMPYAEDESKRIAASIRHRSCREWYAFHGGEEMGVDINVAEKIWRAAIESTRKAGT